MQHFPEIRMFACWQKVNRINRLVALTLSKLLHIYWGTPLKKHFPIFKDLLSKIYRPKILL